MAYTQVYKSSLDRNLAGLLGEGHLSIYRPAISPSIHRPCYPSIIQPSIQLSLIYPSVCTPHSSIHLPSIPSIHLIQPFIYQLIYRPPSIPHPIPPLVIWGSHCISVVANILLPPTATYLPLPLCTGMFDVGGYHRSIHT